jgi:hypothetical protein
MRVASHGQDTRSWCGFISTFDVPSPSKVHERYHVTRRVPQLRDLYHLLWSDGVFTLEQTI